MARLSYRQINELKGVERSSTFNQRVKKQAAEHENVPQQPVQKFKQHRTSNLPGRNEPCYCGSGNKFKHCCYEN